MIKKADINYKSYMQKYKHTCFNSRNKQPPSPNNTLAGLPFSRGPKRRKAKAVRSSTCIHPKRKTKAKRANTARGIWNNPPGWCTEAPRARRLGHGARTGEEEKARKETREKKRNGENENEDENERTKRKPAKTAKGQPVQVRALRFQG